MFNRYNKSSKELVKENNSDDFKEGKESHYDSKG